MKNPATLPSLLLTSLAAILIGFVSCSTTKTAKDDPRGMVMDHDSVAERGGVGNYLFRNDYGDQFAAGESGEGDLIVMEEDEVWEPSASMGADRIDIADEIRFQTGSATLTDNSKLVLDDVAAVIMNNDADITAVEIAGHTDSSGNPQVNEQLSQKRAEAVKGYLVGKGVSSDKLVPVGYGDTEPLYVEDDDLNRRVEFRVQPSAMAE